jgi:His-Xaa-Ser system protein HxsD
MRRIRRTARIGPWSDTAVATEFTTTVDTRIYDLDTIHRATYWFTNRCAIRVARVDENHAQVEFRPLGTEGLSTSIAAEFENELIDFRIRGNLARETAAIRDLIFRQAFVEADL